MIKCLCSSWWSLFNPTFRRYNTVELVWAFNYKYLLLVIVVLFYGYVYITVRMHVHHICAWGCWGQKKVSDVPELELQPFLSHHVAAGNPTQVLYKISKIFPVLQNDILVRSPTHGFIITFHKSLMNLEKPALDPPWRWHLMIRPSLQYSFTSKLGD